MEKPNFCKWHLLLLITVDVRATSQYRQLILATLDFFLFNFKPFHFGKMTYETLG